VSTDFTENTKLPNIGDKIDYGLIPRGYLDKFQTLRGRYGNLRTHMDTIERIGDGQVGPEIRSILGQYGPKGLRRAIGNGQLDLNVNLLRPYIGFTYRF